MKSLTKVGFYLKLSEFVVGFIIVAFATSLPELFVGIISAFENTPELALGTIIGSNIVDLTLVIGIAAILKREIKVETKAVRTDTLYMFAITLMPLILMINRKITKLDGVILIIAFILYVRRLFKQERRFRETIDHVPRKEFVKWVGHATVGLLLLLVSAEILVNVTSDIATDFSVPPMLIGLFLIAFGTSLPELMFEAKAVLLKHQYIALGDLIGSVIANTTLVLGITAILSSQPIVPDFMLFITSAVFMVIVAFMFMTFVDVEKHIHWREGIALILLYVLSVIVELTIRSPGLSNGVLP